MGDAVVAAALAGTIFFEGATSDARGRVFLYLLLTMAPFALVAPLIGPTLDRVQGGRRWVVIGSAVVRALLCLVMIGRTDSLVLYPAAFAVLVLQKGYGVARSSLVPAVVESDEELVEANSKLQLISGISSFVGAAPAGLLFAVSDSPSLPLALAVCVFAATAGLALRIPSVAVAPVEETPAERAEMRSPGVLLAAGGMGLLRGIVGYLVVHFAFHFRELDQLFEFGLVAAVSVIGSLAGSVVAPRLRQVLPEERMLISCLVLTVGAGVLALFSGGTAGAALLGASVGIANTAGKLAFDSIVQRDAPDANRGRLFARFETRFQLIWVVGSMFGLVSLAELRLSFLAVTLVASFAAFSYVIGLTAWNHRTGVSSSRFGRQAVLIDEAMSEGRDRTVSMVRESGRKVVGRVRRGRDGRSTSAEPPDRKRAGPGIGTAVTPIAGTPAVPDPYRVPEPTPAEHAAPAGGDPTVFDPAPPPPSRAGAPPPPPPPPPPPAAETSWDPDDPTEQLPR